MGRLFFVMGNIYKTRKRSFCTLVNKYHGYIWSYVKSMESDAGSALGRDPGQGHSSISVSGICLNCESSGIMHSQLAAITTRRWRTCKLPLPTRIEAQSEGFARTNGPRNWCRRILFCCGTNFIQWSQHTNTMSLLMEDTSLKPAKIFGFAVKFTLFYNKCLFYSLHCIPNTYTTLQSYL